jgi:acetyl-CoA carboxylase biotin carboxyl carrier protein
MNIKELKEMIQLMKDNNIVELELEKEGTKIRLKKSNGNLNGTEGMHLQPVMQPMVQYVQESVAQAQAKAAQDIAAQQKLDAKAEEDAGLVIVRSPMIGTYYQSPAPNAAPYVTVGKEINIDDTLCIVEAMKLMNEIKSEIKGKIVEILVTNGQTVEYDQPLFKVKAS